MTIIILANICKSFGSRILLKLKVATSPSILKPKTHKINADASVKNGVYSMGYVARDGFFGIPSSMYLSEVLSMVSLFRMISID